MIKSPNVSPNSLVKLIHNNHVSGIYELPYRNVPRVQRGSVYPSGEKRFCLKVKHQGTYHRVTTQNRLWDSKLRLLVKTSRIPHLEAVLRQHIRMALQSTQLTVQAYYSNGASKRLLQATIANHGEQKGTVKVINSPKYPGNKFVQCSHINHITGRYDLPFSNGTKVQSEIIFTSGRRASG